MKQDSEPKSYLRRAGQYQDEKIDELLNPEILALVGSFFLFLVFIGYEWIACFYPSLRNPLPLTIAILLLLPVGIYRFTPEFSFSINKSFEPIPVGQGIYASK